MGNFMAHHHGHFVIVQRQLVENACEKSDLAAGHAKRIDLVGANQVDFPFPLARTRVPVVAVRDDFVGNRAQPYHLRMAIRPQRVLAGRLLQHLLVLLHS